MNSSGKAVAIVVVCLVLFLLVFSRSRSADCESQEDAVLIAERARLQSVLDERTRELAETRKELKWTQSQLSHASKNCQKKSQSVAPPKEEAAGSDAEDKKSTCFKPKYHISSMLSAMGVTCQAHGLFLRGHNDPLVVECGAASGSEAAELSHLARVVSYEANPANMPSVYRITAERGVKERIVVRHAACTNISGHLDLFIPDKSRSSQVASVASQAWWSGRNETVQVPAVRLSDEIHEHVTLLKLDVQGAEPDVIDGAKDLIKNYGIDVIHMEFQPVLQIQNKRDPVKFLEMVYDLGYHCFECRFMRRAISPNRDFHNFTYNNYITPFEPKFFQGIIGGITDMVCVHFAEAPGDHWRDKAVPYEVTINNTRSYPKSRRP